eukprot:90548_1
MPIPRDENSSPQNSRPSNESVDSKMDSAKSPLNKPISDIESDHSLGAMGDAGFEFPMMSDMTDSDNSPAPVGLVVVTGSRLTRAHRRPAAMARRINDDRNFLFISDPMVLAFEAVLADDVEGLKSAVQRMDNVNKLSSAFNYRMDDSSSASGAEETLLHLACKVPSPRCFTFLFQYGPTDIMALSSTKQSACHAAALGGSVAMLRTLIRANLHADWTDETGKTPLHCATLGGHLEAVRVLIKEFHVDINAECMCGYTALMYAVDSPNYLKVSKGLLELGANVNAADMDGATALTWALQSARADLVELLLHHRADISIRNVRNEDALAFAELLIGQVVGQGDQPKSKSSARGISTNTLRLRCLRSVALELLWQSVESEDRRGVQRALSHLSIKILKENSIWKDPQRVGTSSADHRSLLIARPATYDSGDCQILQMLMDREVDLFITDRYGRFGLHLAASEGNVEAIRILVKYGSRKKKQFVNTTSLDENMGTALINAFSNQNERSRFKTVDALISLGADPNIPDSFGNTPLIWAVHYGFGYTKLIQYLLALKDPSTQGPLVDIDMQNSLGNTALHYAVCRIWVRMPGKSEFALAQEYVKILKLLFKHGANLTTIRNNQNCSPWDLSVDHVRTEVKRFRARNPEKGGARGQKRKRATVRWNGKGEEPGESGGREAKKQALSCRNVELVHDLSDGERNFIAENLDKYSLHRLANLYCNERIVVEDLSFGGEHPKKLSVDMAGSNEPYIQDFQYTSTNVDFVPKSRVSTVGCVCVGDCLDNPDCACFKEYRDLQSKLRTEYNKLSASPRPPNTSSPSQYLPPVARKSDPASSPPLTDAARTSQQSVGGLSSLYRSISDDSTSCSGLNGVAQRSSAVGLAAVGLATVKSARAEPTTVDLTALSSSRSNSVDPTRIDLTTLSSSTGSSNLAGPTTVQPTTVHPTTVQPTTVHPTTVHPAAVHPTTTTVNPTPGPRNSPACTAVSSAVPSSIFTGFSDPSRISNGVSKSNNQISNGFSEKSSGRPKLNGVSTTAQASSSSSTQPSLGSNPARSGHFSPSQPRFGSPSAHGASLSPRPASCSKAAVRNMLSLPPLVRSWDDVFPQKNCLNDEIQTVFECHSNCRCSVHPRCSNRVTHSGRIAIDMQVFYTRDKGMCVRSLEPIKKGQYVTEYVGEAISPSEADQRQQDVIFSGTNYIFTPNEYVSIDASKWGNAGRFMAHSCNPNLSPKVIYSHNKDPRFARVAFFANCDIPIREELTIDYHYDQMTWPGMLLICKCGEKSCARSLL